MIITTTIISSSGSGRISRIGPNTSSKVIIKEGRYEFYTMLAKRQRCLWFADGCHQIYSIPAASYYFCDTVNSFSWVDVVVNLASVFHLLHLHQQTWRNPIFLSFDSINLVTNRAVYRSIWEWTSWVRIFSLSVIFPQRNSARLTTTPFLKIISIYKGNICKK